MSVSTNKKALFFVNSPIGGGAEKVCINLAKALSDTGIGSVFITLYPKEFNWPEFIENYCLNLTSRKVNLKKNEVWNSFEDKYSIDDFCLVTAHLPMSHIVASKSSFSNKCLYVIHNNTNNNWSTAWFKRLVIRRFYSNKQLSFVCNDLQKHWIDKFEILKTNTNSIYNPIDVIFSASNNEITSKLQPYVVCVGRLCKQKNQSLAIKIFANSKIRESHKLLFLGEGKDKQKLMNLATKLNINNSIEFLGYVDNPYQIIKYADLLISTSIYEGFNMVVAEAIACGTPVIATDCDFGPREIMTGKSKRYLIPDSYSNEELINYACEMVDSVTEDGFSNFDDIDIDQFKPKTIVKKYLNAWKDKCQNSN